MEVEEGEGEEGRRGILIKGNEDEKRRERGGGNCSQEGGGRGKRVGRGNPRQKIKKGGAI